MKKDKIRKLIDEGYKPLVYLTSNKDYSKMILKTILQKNNSNIVYPVYYNHIKTILKKHQLEFIDSYNKAKLLKFSDIVELNIKFKNNTIDKNDMKLLVMYRAIKNMDYLEQK